MKKMSKLYTNTDDGNTRGSALWWGQQTNNGGFLVFNVLNLILLGGHSFKRLAKQELFLHLQCVRLCFCLSLHTKW